MLQILRFKVKLVCVAWVQGLPGGLKTPLGTLGPQEYALAR